MGDRTDDGLRVHWQVVESGLLSSMEKDGNARSDESTTTADIAAEATTDSSPAQTAPETLPPPARSKNDGDLKTAKEPIKGRK